MYIKNATKEILDSAYKCNKNIAHYLIYTCGLPILSIVKNQYYFAKTEKLENAVKNLPIVLGGGKEVKIDKKIKICC